MQLLEEFRLELKKYKDLAEVHECRIKTLEERLGTLTGDSSKALTIDVSIS